VLNEILDLLAKSFPDDPSAPSVVLAKLPNGKFYGSLVRYEKPFGEGRQVLFKKAADDLDTIFTLMKEVLGGT
jgi:hypothetical protein